MSIFRSLAKDGPDTTALHSPKWREDKDVPVKSLGEQVPFFYTRGGAVLPLEGQYRGGHAFLMANGPSVAALDLTPLHRRWVMTMNNGARTFRGNANCTVDEPSRFSLSMWLDPTILKFAPMSHFEKPLWDNRLVYVGEEQGGGCVEQEGKTPATAWRATDGWVQRWEASKLKLGDCPNVAGYRRNEKYHAPRWLNEETINWGNHGKWGGGRSVLLASLRILFLLGFRKVYLLGVDFEMSGTQRYHFDEGRTANAIKGNMSTYAKLQAWFAELQPHFLKAGYVVRNCNAQSKLTAFPFISYEDALAESGVQMGDPSRERTEGMYSRAADAKQGGATGSVAAEIGATGPVASEGGATGPVAGEATKATAGVHPGEPMASEPGMEPRSSGGESETPVVRGATRLQVKLREAATGPVAPLFAPLQAQLLELEEKLRGEDASEACESELFAMARELERNGTTPLRTQQQVP